TARAFLKKIAVFKERAAWHGHSAEGNPSAGNQYRGLYNIVLKSIGAARKKHPDVRLDYVIDYAQPMSEPGYYFMDSPGNDLESIAGQVASGANLILFITGNGSITNFPFVPTLKYVTTTGRWEMLSNEMDVNAGRYQDGTPMEALGAECFEQVLAVASGQQSLGEKAGHSQVSIWRDWRQTGPGGIDAILQRPKPSGAPLPVLPAGPGGGAETFRGFRNGSGISADRVGLIFPTSLCSAKVAGMIADDLNQKGTAGDAVSRYVALAHTEGCGAAPGYSLELLVRTVKGHLGHPMVGRALVLEHGCEQTVNDTMREFLETEGLDVSRLGWASIQMDGGIAQVMEKAEKWFSETLKNDGQPQAAEAGLEHLRLGLTAGGDVDDGLAAAMAGVARAVAGAGGLVVVPENASLLASDAFRQGLLADPGSAAPSLGYGEPAANNGLHIMETPTDHAVETLTGLGATGVEVMLACLAGAPMQGHPMIPLLQVSNHPATVKRFGKDLDLSLTEMGGEEAAGKDITRAILERVLEVASRRYVPRLTSQGNTDFQLTRGWLGLSL
ncbi:MAG: UxaA family hydrolase, partial [bacterium]